MKRLKNFGKWDHTYGDLNTIGSRIGKGKFYGR